MEIKYKQHLKNAKKRGIPSSLTLQDFWKLKISDCFYCDIPHYLLHYYCQYMQVRTPWITLDRKDNSLGYTRDNTVACCFLCNRTKGALFTAQEFFEIAQKYIKPKWILWENEVDYDFGEWCKINVNSPWDD